MFSAKSATIKILSYVVWFQWKTTFYQTSSKSLNSFKAQNFNNIGMFSTIVITCVSIAYLSHVVWKVNMNITGHLDTTVVDKSL